ncbi:MAG: DUF805 domain-containing protein [Caldimonas sp.]
MDTTNRFAPPGARVEDVALAGEGVQPIRLWPPNGRIGRLRFLAYSSGLYIVFFAITFLLGVLAGVTNMSPLIASVIGFAIYAIGTAILLVERSHDMDLSGWWGIAALIPLVGLYWLFKGGTRGANRWGLPPPPNGWAVRIIGLIFPVIFVIGIVAAIALPAYQDYSTRAKAGISR